MKSRWLLFPLFVLAQSPVAQGAINFEAAVSTPVGDEPEGGVLFDFTGDGLLDLAVTSSNPNKIEFFANEGEGTFAAPFSLLTGNGTGPEGLAVGDFNDDGNIDLVVALFGTNQVRLVLGDGAGNFSLGNAASVGVEPSVVVAADFDADGLVDAAVNNRVSGDMSVLLNNGLGGFETAVHYAVGIETRCIAVGDLTGDDLPDLVVSARDSRIVRLFENVGGGAFETLRDLSLGALLQPQGVTIADLDGDGALDVVTATSGNELQEHVSVFLQNNGSNHWVGPINGATGGTSPTGIAAADFDLDGVIDVATSNADSNNLSALRNAGIGIFFAPMVFPVGERPETQVLLCGDLDRNGSSDLVTLNQDSEDASVLINRNAAAAVGIEGTSAALNGLRLEPAAPNPARGATSLVFSLPHPSEVTMNVIDAAGRKVRSLISAPYREGTHRIEWDGRNDAGRFVASGTYWIELSAGASRTTQRLVFVR